jgi:hypothetical protein
MHTYVYLAFGAFLLVLFAWRINQLIKLHARTLVDPAPDILGPKEVHRHRL